MRTFIVARGLIGAALGSITMLLGAPAGASSELLGCDAPVYDPAGLVDTATRQIVATTGTAWGIDLRVRVEQPAAGLAARLTELEERCPGWRENGDVAPGLLVIIVSPAGPESASVSGVLPGSLNRNVTAATNEILFGITTGDPESVSAAITSAMVTLSTTTQPDIPTFTVPRRRSFSDGSSWNWIRFAIKPALFVIVAVFVQVTRLLKRRGRSAPSVTSYTPPPQPRPTPPTQPPPPFGQTPFRQPAPPPPPVATDDVLTSWGISSTIPPPPPPGDPR